MGSAVNPEELQVDFLPEGHWDSWAVLCHHCTLVGTSLWGD